MQISKIPKHIAIIMDGNGTWAKKNNLRKEDGHKCGVRTAKKIISYVIEKKIKNLTLYALSNENLSRPKLEVKKLFEIFLYSFTHEKNFLFENKIKIKFIGDLDELPVTIKLEAKLLENETKLFKQLNLNIALNYGGKQDIEQAVKKSLSTDIRNSNFKNFLYSKDLPDVDILIRTGGYKRLSNFLLWQIPYAELYFTNICWPDFNKKSFLKSLDWYSSIDRKFGKSYSVK